MLARDSDGNRQLAPEGVAGASVDALAVRVLVAASGRIADIIAPAVSEVDACIEVLRVWFAGLGLLDGHEANPGDVGFFWR